VLTSRGTRIFAASSIDGFQALTIIVLAMLVRLNPCVHEFPECIGADIERSEDLQGLFNKLGCLFLGGHYLFDETTVHQFFRAETQDQCQCFNEGRDWNRFHKGFLLCAQCEPKFKENGGFPTT